MRDRGAIYIGLLIFLILATIPIWYNLAISEESSPPDLVLPHGETACVADTVFMRTEHMAVLSDWRDEVVRERDVIFETADGRAYYKSLTGTCLGCHDQKEDFCDRCHDYLSVDPYCWDCHVIPKGEK